MLKSWHIEHFKPIVDSGELALAPVTVLAGRNSSGKSSLIQSILMIAQTLSSRLLDRALLPNGPIVQLGTFEDILSDHVKSKTLKVGFELEVDNKKEQQNLTTYKMNPSGEELFLVGISSRIQSIRVIAEFRSGSTNGASASAIEASKVNVEQVSLKVTALPPSNRPFLRADGQIVWYPDKTPETLLDFEAYIKRLSSSELDHFLQEVASEYLRLVPYGKNENNYLGTFQANNSFMTNPSLVTFSHFLPTRFIQKYNIEEGRKRQIKQILDFMFLNPEHAFYEADMRKTINTRAPLSEILRKSLTDFCQSENLRERFSGETLYDLFLWHKSLRLGRRKSTITSKLIEIVAQEMLESVSQEGVSTSQATEALEPVTNSLQADCLTGGVDQIVQFFTSKIRYLGPLRADPQAAQRFAPTSELDDVGAKGEYAGAVYDANQNAIIRWYHPFLEKIISGPLKEALNTWARYLGVANEVTTREAGQSGVSWQVVHMEGHKALPLTAVGVGVSQLLPILVMGLLAPNNTLLLVEQPELHLHSHVQARLGDFFMGLAKCGKQCLIETHSENLISQLRYHIVQAGGLEQSDCLIYFVDQDEQGAARFAPVEISSKGNILNWPDGFFDETMLQEDRITAASLKKQTKKASNG